MDAALRSFEPDSEAVREGRLIAAARAAVGWGVVGGLLLYGAAVGLAPDLLGSSAATVARAVAGLAPEEVATRWVENATAGPLLVIDGRLRPVASGPVEPGTQLRVRLLGADGAPIAAESAVVGPPLAEERLREWSWSDLRGFHEEEASEMAWRPWAAPDPRPFQAILAGVPAAAAGFEFQAARADPPVPPEADAASAVPVDAALSAGAAIPD